MRTFLRFAVFGAVLTVLAGCGTGVKAGGRLGADAHAKWDNGPAIGAGVTLPEIEAHGAAVPGALPGTHAAPPAPVIVAPPTPAHDPTGENCPGGVCRPPEPVAAAPSADEVGAAVARALAPALKAQADALARLEAPRPDPALAPPASPPATPPAPKVDTGAGFWGWVGYVALCLVIGAVAVATLVGLGLLTGDVGRFVARLYRRVFPKKTAAPPAS